VVEILFSVINRKKSEVVLRNPLYLRLRKLAKIIENTKNEDLLMTEVKLWNKFYNILVRINFMKYKSVILIGYSENN